MWQIRVQEPSGETRTIPLQGQLKGPIVLGKSQKASIPLRDATLTEEAAILSPIVPIASSISSKIDSPYWLQVPQEAPPCRLGDLAVRSAHLPPNLPLIIGETRITIESDHPQSALPVQPSGVRPWLTRSEEGRQVLWTTKKAACTPLSVYLAGETGTGKEVLAHLVHAWSDQSSGPFVPLHCGALPVSLAESELFGHVKGAFTGATHHRAGALMQAHGGTLFLDEIGDLPLDIQVKLLRFLENGEIRPIGADRPSRADVRIVCATHHPLKNLVQEGKFRRDLYYRLASVIIEIPPLRSRPEDIDMLAKKFSTELDRTLSHAALLRLKIHAWPGNVRELRHAIERASGLMGPFTRMLDESAFEFLLTAESISNTPQLALGAPVLTLYEMERTLVLRALQLANGNRSRAAKILGIARSTLFEKLKRHQIRGPKMTS